jgi:hypothetical protein
MYGVLSFEPQPLRRRRQLWLAGFGTPAPGLEVKALGHARQGREDHVQFAANVVPLAVGESGDHPILLLTHPRGLARRDFRAQSWERLPRPHTDRTAHAKILGRVGPPERIRSDGSVKLPTSQRASSQPSIGSAVRHRRRTGGDRAGPSRPGRGRGLGRSPRRTHPAGCGLSGTRFACAFGGDCASHGLIFGNLADLETVERCNVLCSLILGAAGVLEGRRAAFCPDDGPPR